MAPRTQTLLNTQHKYRYVVAIVLLVALLSGVNWILKPELALRWLGSMLTLPVLWFGLMLWRIWMRRRAAIADDHMAIERYFVSALTLVIAGVGIVQIVRLSLDIWFTSGDHRGDLEFGRRILGFVVGVVFIFVGNAMPKILTPLSVLPPDLAHRVTSARRFVGRIFVLLGLAVASAFLLLSFAFAKALVQWGAIGGLLTTLGAIIWMNRGPATREQ